MNPAVILPDELSESVQDALRRLFDEIGELFSMDQLIGYLVRWRGKELRIEEDIMPPGITGYSVALRDCDLIATRRGLTKTQRQVTQFHEIGHFVKGDMPLLSRGEQTTVYRKFITQRDRHAFVTSRNRFFDSYDDHLEYDAECLARIFMQITNLHAKQSNQILSDVLGGLN
jgi:hypothetical protein